MTILVNAVLIAAIVIMGSAIALISASAVSFFVVG